MLSLLTELQRELPVDPRRIYLTGLSRGGFGAWRLAIQNPDRFAALVLISGGGPLPYAKRISHVPIWAFHGAKDPVIPVDELRCMVEAVNKAGGTAKLTIYPEAQHDPWTQAYEDPALFVWLLKQQTHDQQRAIIRLARFANAFTSGFWFWTLLQRDSNAPTVRASLPAVHDSAGNHLASPLGRRPNRIEPSCPSKLLKLEPCDSISRSRRGGVLVEMVLNYDTRVNDSYLLFISAC